MPISKLHFIKRCAEFIPKEELDIVPHNTRGIYVLYCRHMRKHAQKPYFDVVYVGMAGESRASIHGRLVQHAKSKLKRDLWTHFSFFEVWDNIQEDEVRELEGILRHIYRKDRRANVLNQQGGFMKLRKVHDRDLQQYSQG
jgi:hypothetical protein